MSFPLVGNSKVKGAICGAIACGKIPHAIIIEGEKGLGKHTLAKYISAAAVCSGDNAPCLKCAQCHLADIDSHPDIATIAAPTGKKSIAVAQIRELIAEAYVKPHQAARRVFIIDGAHTMNEQSQNTLLKVLEEPPADIIFILIAETKATLLDTIISRCVLFSLSVPEENEAVKYISGKTDKLSEKDIREALNSCGFNIGTALNVLSGSKNAVKVAAEQFLEAAIKKDELSMMKIAHTYEKDRVGVDGFVAAIKYEISLAIKKKYKSKITAKKMFEYYEAVTLYEKNLKTNINLSLFFAGIICKAVEIF